MIDFNPIEKELSIYVSGTTVSSSESKTSATEIIEIWHGHVVSIRHVRRTQTIGLIVQITKIVTSVLRPHILSSAISAVPELNTDWFQLEASEYLTLLVVLMQFFSLRIDPRTINGFRRKGEV